MTLTAGRRWLLLDKSALVRGGGIPKESLGRPCICAITRLEMLHSARSGAGYQQQVEERLAAFHELRMSAETIAAAVAAHRELGQKGRHRLPIPDLLIAACAEQHQAAVLHVDRHYDVLAEVLAFEPVRLAL
ncbi:MAG TPA: PIN domain-containing protein [Solirubrobacteraceae bacterium]|nr:PIN domain-containing protein [Solirubrobacteraceae bacterium]